MALLVKFDPEDVRPFIPSIVEQSKLETSALGFLPSTHYYDAALKGLLLVATCDESQTFVGFILFSRHKQYVKVQQLFVVPKWRRRGAGSLLIEHLVQLSETWHCFQIQAKVASELEANRFWESHDFKIGSQKAGRTKGRDINLRFRILKQALFIAPEEIPLEFSRPLLTTPVYVLDLNVVIDQLRDRADSESAREVLRQALSGQFSLFTTPELQRELIRNQTNFSQDPLLRFAQSIPALQEVDESLLEAISAKIVSMVFPDLRVENRKYRQSIADVRHLAYCVHYRASAFVTREKLLLACASAFYTKFSVEIVSPGELVSPLLGAVNFPPFEALSAETEEPRISEISMSQLDSVRDFLLNNGFHISEIDAVLHSHAFANKGVSICILSRDVLVGFAAWSHQRSRCTGLACVDQDYSQRDRVADGILETLLRDGDPLHVRTIELSLPLDQGSIRDVARVKGFHFSPQDPVTLSKLCVNGVVDKSNWPRLLKKFEETTNYRLPHEFPKAAVLKNTGLTLREAKTGSLRTISVFDTESLLSPCALIHEDRCGIIVPIRAGFAENLIYDANRQRSLFAKRVPLYLERAYFRTPTGSKLIEKGMLLFFYVSGSGGGAKAIIGFARCTFSDVISVEQASIRFSRQGVFNEADLRATSRNGNVHIFTFDNFNHFKHEVSLSEMRRWRIDATSSLITIRSLRPVEVRRIVDLGYKNTTSGRSNLNSPRSRGQNSGRRKNRRTEEPPVSLTADKQALDLLHSSNGSNSPGRSSRTDRDPSSR